MPEQTAHGAPPETNGKGRVSFSDVARAHFEWDMSNDTGAREAFEEKLDAFEAQTGEVIDAYWCRTDASAVALTRVEPERRSGVRRLLRRNQPTQYRLFRLSDWVTGEAGQIPDLLHECDVLAIKAAHGLDGTPQAVVMRWLLAVEAHTLGFIERHRNRPPGRLETTEFVARQTAKLRKIEDYYHWAGERRGRLFYMEGMLFLGVVLLLLAGAASAGVFELFGVLDLESNAVREFYACAAAGAAGALVSVLMRMAGRRGGFTIDHELGRWGVTILGGYRPLLGSISGIVVYFLVQTPLVPVESGAQTLPFHVVIAFLAGFSERWTQVVLDGAMRTVGEPGAAAGEVPDRTTPAATANGGAAPGDDAPRA